jgi:hypothetical protein
LTEFQNFSELRQGNHPEMHHSDTALFRLPKYGLISFYVNSGNSEILSTWPPYLESNGSPLSTIQCTAFPNLIAMKNLAWGRGDGISLSFKREPIITSDFPFDARLFSLAKAVMILA